MKKPMQGDPDFAQEGVFPDGKGGYAPCPTLLTEDELIRFLRIPEITNAKNHHNVIENLKRAHNLPRIHLCGKTVFLTEAIKEWLQHHVIYGQ